LARCTPSLSFLLSTPSPPPEISTLSLHDALPICHRRLCVAPPSRRQGSASSGQFARPAAQLLERGCQRLPKHAAPLGAVAIACRSEEHTSELQSLTNLVCRLLLEKKKTNITTVLS